MPKKRIKEPERMEARNERIKAAMATLIANTNFKVFIELLHELKDEAFLEAVSKDSVKDQRLSLAALGEARALNDIIGIYENFRDQLQNNLATESE